ncbi:MAG: hypothetical protein GXY86_04090 [Firmicutes bacterium]|nr:hypothetical protein [Bacillota bacterium]
MEEAQRIFDYLPISPLESEYIQFLWEAFESNVESEKYQFGYIAYHMLFMCFIYYQIAKIYKVDCENCKNLMVFTGKVQNHIDAHESKILAGKDSVIAPLRFSEENERTIMGLFLLIQCNRDEIKRLKNIVDSRNEIAHSNGNIFYKTKESLEEKIDEMLSCIEVIQRKSIPIIEKAYRDFLIESCDPETREFYDDENQISQILIQGNYLSLEDIRIAKECDIAVLSEEAGFDNIQSLDETLNHNYTEEE